MHACVYLCLHVCLYTYVYMSVEEFVHAQEDSRFMSDISFDRSLLYIKGKVSQLNPALTDLCSLGSHLDPGTPCLCCPHVGISGRPPQPPSIYLSVGDPNSSP